MNDKEISRDNIYGFLIKEAHSREKMKGKFKRSIQTPFSSLPLGKFDGFNLTV